MALSDDVRRIAAAAGAYAAPDEAVAAVLPVELATGDRVYLVAFARDSGASSWIALEDDESPVRGRSRVREATSIAALVEVAEDEGEDARADEPRIASLAYLDSLGAEAAASIQGAMPAVEELALDVQGNYKLELT